MWEGTWLLQVPQIPANVAPLHKPRPTRLAVRNASKANLTAIVASSRSGCRVCGNGRAARMVGDSNRAPAWNSYYQRLPYKLPPLLQALWHERTPQFSVALSALVSQPDRMYCRVQPGP